MEYPTLPLLRNRALPTAAFRTAAAPIIRSVIVKLHQHLLKMAVQEQNIVFVIILRAGLAFLDATIQQFPVSMIACAGLRRDEETAKAHWYYKNFPLLCQKHTAVILDPMLATGGSAMAVAQELQHRGILAQNTHYVGLLGAPEGIMALSGMIPHENILLAKIDDCLDAKKFIVPGLGDFGDRYFGYVPTSPTPSVAPNTPQMPAATVPRSSGSSPLQGVGMRDVLHEGRSDDIRTHA